MSRRSNRSLLAAGITVFLMSLAGGQTWSAETRVPDMSEITELNAAASDPERAGWAVKRLRQLIPDLDDNYARFLRQILFRAQILSSSPPADIMGTADTLIAAVSDFGSRVILNASVAEAFINRGVELDRAAEYAERAVAACPNGAQFSTVRASAEALLGRVHLARGDFESAIEVLERAAPAAQDSHVVLRHLGEAQQKAGQTDRAISAYVRSLSAFPPADTGAAAPLRALYLKRHGSLKGLEERIEAARRESRQRVALDAHRHDAPAPHWALPDFQGKLVQLSDFKGKTLVVDFWGSWCGPCRAELPHFQAVYDRFKDRGVAFVGINWERNATAAERLSAAKGFMKTAGYTFPVVMDHDRKAVVDYSIQAFPTVFVIDGTGQIRYRIVGFNEAVEPILTAQIESLMK